MNSDPVVAGHVSLRPVRVGLIFPSSAADLRKAIQQCSTAWGGGYNHFFAESMGYQAIKERSELAFIDSLSPLAKTRFQDLSPEIANYHWRGHNGNGPFNGPISAYNHSAISTEWLLKGRQISPISPAIADDDPLQLYIAALVGEVCPDAPYDLTSYFESVDASSPQGLSELVAGCNPVRSTLFETQYATPDIFRGVMLVDSKAVDDLIRFWNLRAIGVDLFPWDERFAERIGPAFEAWLEQSIEPALPAFVPPYSIQPNGQPDSEELLIWTKEPDGVLPDTLASHLSRHDISFRVSVSERVLMFCGSSPVKTRFEHSFESSPVHGRGRGMLSLPMPSIHPQFSSDLASGVVAVDLQFNSENRMPPGETIGVPPLRRLTRMISTSNNSAEVFHRPILGGQSIGLSSSSDRVYFKHLPTIIVLGELLKEEAWTLSQSDNGLFAEQLAERLGGRSSEMANEPAVRSVLHSAATAERASPFAFFRQKARDAQGEYWPKRAHFAQPDLYSRDVVYRLLRSKLLHLAAKVRCPHCANDTDVSPEGLSTDITCQLCDETYPLGFAVSVQRGSGWSYRLSPTIQPARLSESLALLATLSVVKSLGTGPSSTGMHMLGLKLEAKHHKCEVDLVAAIDRGRTLMPHFVVGEVKSRYDGIEKQDIQNLEVVQRAIHATGLPCTILCASLRSEFDDSERAELKQLCERSIAALDTSPRSALPLVLTASDLSASWFDPPHPAQWDGPGSSLAEVAYESCRRNLGLESIVAAHDAGPKLTWS